MSGELPEELQGLLDEAKEYMAEAEAQMNYANHQIGLWHCSQGQHTACTYINPPIGRACLRCREPMPEPPQPWVEIEA